MTQNVEVAFFQSVRQAIEKGKAVPKPESVRPQYERAFAVQQLVSKPILPGGVVNLFQAAGLEKPNIALLSDEFLEELRNLPRRNLALELLKRLLNEELKARSKTNVVRARTFAQMLEDAIKRYTSQSIEMTQLVDELVELTKALREQRLKGNALDLSQEEAFYDALATNDNAVEVMGNEQLIIIAKELLSVARTNATIDWHVRESVRANLRRLIKRILRKYGYPPNLEGTAVQFVIEQAEVICHSS